MKQILKITVYPIVILTMLSSALVYFLTTEQGLHWSFAMATKIIPGKLTAQKLQGRLLGPIDIAQLSYKNNRIRLTADTIHLNWQISDLFLSKIKITALKINNLTIKTKTSTGTPTGKLNLNKLKLLSHIQPKDIQLHNISWQQDTRSPIKITSIIWQVQQNAANIMVLQGKILAPDLSLLIQGTIQKTWDLNWQLHLAKLENFLPQVTGSAACTGKITGANNLNIKTALKISQFQYKTLAWANLQGEAEVNLAKKSPFTLNIKAPKIGSLHFSELTLAGHIFKQHGLVVKTTLALSSLDPINIALKFPSFNPTFYKQPLHAQLSWQTKNLTFLPTIFPQIQKPHGTLDAKYTINGTIQQPKISGSTKITNASMYIPRLNLQLQNIELNAQTNHNKTTYQAVMHSGTGAVNSSGEVLFSPQKISSTLLLDGQNFLIANTPEYKIITSAQLELQTKNTMLELTGKISIPQANIAPGYFGRSSLLPSEVVLVKPGQTAKTKSLNLYTQLQLNLGDNVFIDIMGLAGKAKGQLKLSTDPQKNTTALGTLYLNHAYYTLGGKQLPVTKGSLHFLGGAITNPEVNLEIIRNFNANDITTKNLTVGIRMHGMLDNLKTNFFSIPAGLSNSDILSYLIIGQSYQHATDNKTQLLFQAATTLNLAGTSKMSNLFGTLRKKLGFSELGLTQETQQQKKSDNLMTSTAFSLGRFLTPKIYISYSIGLAEPINIFRAKYYLNKYWSIQSENSPLGNGADLFYTIERD